MAFHRGDLLSNVLLGTDSADILYGGGVEFAPLDLSDTILAGSGADAIYGNGSYDFLLGELGADTLYGGVGDDTLYGGRSVLDIQDSADWLYGQSGNDWLFGNGGDDTLEAGDGTDTIYGGGGDDFIYGGNTYASEGDGADWIAAGSGSDTIYGNEGNDSIFGGNGINDSLDAADILDGGAGNDILYGNGGDDWLISGAGNDTLYGGLGSDTLEGGAGTDVIVGDAYDVISGGDGIDRFVMDVRHNLSSIFSAAATASDAPALFIVDTDIPVIRITDMEEGETLRLDNLNGRTATIASGGENNAVIIIDGETLARLEGVTFAEIRVNNQNSAQMQISRGDPALNDNNTGGSAPQSPVNSVPAAQSTNEDATLTFSSGGGNLISVSDADNASLTAYTLAVTQGTLTLSQTTGLTFATGDGTNDATMTFGGTLTDINAALDGLVYTPTANYNGADTLTLTANDGTTTDVDTVAITVNAVNDDPVLSNLGAASFNENTVNASPQLLDSDVSLTDDSINFNGGNLTVTYSIGGGTEDNLSIRNVGTGAGQIGYNGSTVTYGGTTIGTISGSNHGLNGANLVVSLNSSATTAAVEALIENIIYRNSTNTPTASRTVSITVNDGASTSAAVTSAVTITAQSDNVTLSALDGVVGVRVDGVAVGDVAGFSVSFAGDVNNDGFADILVGAPTADPGGDSNAGESYVIFGKASGWASSLALSSLDGTTGFSMQGIDTNDQSGRSVSSAGDVNGDGIDDLLIGARWADPGGDSNAGENYVIFGKSTAWAATLDLSTLNGATGFRLDGIDASDETGRAVSNGGDINGDGYEDILIGARGGDPGGDSSAGESYIVFGKGTAWASTLDLSTLNGTTGVRLDGIDADDFSGHSLSYAGDLNGDGFGDVVIGAYGADPGGDSLAGESYVVFGKASGWASNIDLSTLTGTDGFRLDGIDANDYSGRGVSDAGDINGDGFDDLIVGAYQADPGGSGRGESYVIFGKESGWASSLDLSTMDGTIGFQINGIQNGSRSGFSVASAGDFNGDGYSDVIVSGHLASSPSPSTAGETYIVFGGASGWSATFALSGLNGNNGLQLDGIDNNDQSSWSVSGTEDINGDGFDDIIIGGRYASESYIVFGNNQFGYADQVGTSSAENLYGTSSGDVIVAGLGNDTVDGNDGADVLKGANGNDSLTGGVGNDRLFGGNGTDTIDGSADDDMIYGGDNSDSLTGGSGADKMWGENGNDTITGGTGTDRLYGGLGNDVFIFAAGDSTSTNLDIVGLNWDQDTLDITGAAADTVNTVAAVTANALADVVAAYNNTGINQIGDANLIQVTAGTLSGKSYVILSTDGNATYDEGVDLFFQVIGGGTFTTADII